MDRRLLGIIIISENICMFLISHSYCVFSELARTSGNLEKKLVEDTLKVHKDTFLLIYKNTQRDQIPPHSFGCFTSYFWLCPKARLWKSQSRKIGGKSEWSWSNY